MVAAPPRFVARIVAVDEAGDPEDNERPADTTGGTVYSSDGYLLCEIDWIEPVATGEVVKWLEAACDAIDAA